MITVIVLRVLVLQDSNFYSDILSELFAILVEANRVFPPELPPAPATSATAATPSTVGNAADAAAQPERTKPTDAAAAASGDVRPVSSRAPIDADGGDVASSKNRSTKPEIDGDDVLGDDPGVGGADRPYETGACVAVRHHVTSCVL